MGVLKAKVGGVWEAIGSVNEYEVGATTPTDPNVELWFDTSDPGSTLIGLQRGTYTPTLTGMVVGTGGTPSNTADYTFIGGPNVGDRGLLYIRGYIEFGTTGQTFPTAPSFSLPTGFNLVKTTGGYIAGKVNLNDVTALNQDGVMWCLGANAVRPLCVLLSGVNPYYDVLATTKPFTWASGDRMEWTIDTDAVRV